MRPPNYEYRGLLADTWDLLRGDTSTWPDRAFYLRFVRDGGEPVLDVGCGTGRLLLDYLAQGCDVEGVDSSPEMLAHCARKAERMGVSPRLYQQAMEQLDLPRRYRTVLVPSSSFQLLTNVADAEGALRRFHAHLEPGGRLILPFMIGYRGTKATGVVQTKWRLNQEAARDDGAIVRRWSRYRFDLDQRLSDSEDRFEVLVAGRVVQREHHKRCPELRWYSQDEIVAMLQAAGFPSVQLFREFSEDPAGPADPVFTAVATRG